MIRVYDYVIIAAAIDDLFSRKTFSEKWIAQD